VPPLIALHKQTRSIPIVFVQVSDPIKLGLVASLARPGGNITGFVNFEHSIGGKWIESLKGIAPDTNRVSVLFDPENPAMASYVEAISAAAPSFAVPVTPAGVRNSTDIESTMNALAQQPRGALIVLPNAVTIRYRDLIVAMAISQRLPAIYVYRLFTRAGGLISYGVDLSDQYRLAAGYVDRILKGEHAGELPIQLPAKFEMVINLKTARALGLAIPPTLLALADEVIE
jgi:putative ABC transport system substrate-binding protein